MTAVSLHIGLHQKKERKKKDQIFLCFFSSLRGYLHIYTRIAACKFYSENDEFSEEEEGKGDVNLSSPFWAKTVMADDLCFWAKARLSSTSLNLFLIISSILDYNSFLIYE